MGDALAYIGLAGLTLFGIYSCTNSDWMREQDRQRAAKESADRQPRVIREADGCKVYAFKEGAHWHFFTRCPTSTTTERTYTQACGKTQCQELRSEVIVTENGR